MTEICVYYDQKSEQIIDFFPNNINKGKESHIRALWSQEIPRKILKLLSVEQEITAPQIKAKIGHSMSTLHENIKKLEESELIETKMVYIGNKKKIITPNVIFVTKNPKFKSIIQTFLNKGLWIDSKKLNKITDFLDENPDKSFTAEDVSAKINIPVDEIHSLLATWDSQITRAASTFLKKKPFKKVTTYKSTKNDKF